MTVFDYIMAPFLYLIRELFFLGYDLTNNYGYAIILLSFAISTLLLPIYIFIEKAKTRDDAIKRKMKPVLDEIKRCYKGQDRYYYIRTLHRQHNYSSIRSLIPILSLLLQIPFFIAAYQFLDNFEPLKNLGFLAFKDLSQPDGLLFGANLLPILMTIVNLITARFYTRFGDKAERKQMSIVAGLFLVLLYSFPSGLVLYWTMNNLFSFFRLFITNPEVFAQKELNKTLGFYSITAYKDRLWTARKKILYTFIVLSVVAILSQLNWAFMNNFDDILVRLPASMMASLGLTLFLAIIGVSVNLQPTLTEKFTDRIFKIMWVDFKPQIFGFSTLAFIFLNHYFTNQQYLSLHIVAALTSGFVLAFLTIILNYAYSDKIRVNSNFSWNIFHFPIGYRIVFLIFLIVSVASQINWAVRFDFKDIVLRLVGAILGSWLFSLLLANFIQRLAKESGGSFPEIKEEIRTNIPIIKILFSTLAFLSVLSQINWAMQFNFNDFYLRLPLSIILSGLATVFIVFIFHVVRLSVPFVLRMKVSPVYAFVFLFLAIYYYLSAEFHFLGFNKSLAFISAIFSVAAQAILLLSFFQTLRGGKHNLLLVLKVLIFLLIFFQVISTITILKNNSLIFDFANTQISTSNVTWNSVSFLGVLISAILLPFYLTIIKEPENQFQKKHVLAYILSVLFLSTYIFLWHPISVYSSSPESFGFPAIELLKTNSIPMLFVLFTGLLLYFITPKKIKVHLLSFTISFVLIVIIYSVIIPLNMETLQMHKFSNTKGLETTIFIHLMESLFLVSLYIFVKKMVYRTNPTYILWALVLLTLTPMVQNIGSITTSKRDDLDQLKIETSATISFSKEKKNVVVIMVDMFQGWYLQKILEDKPVYKTQLEGFTWYPNTIALSNYTISSMPSLIAGFDYTPAKLDLDTTKNLYGKMDIAGKAFRDKIKKQGYHLTGNPLSWTGDRKYYFDRFLPDWHDEWNYLKPILALKQTKDYSYNILWKNALFFSLPMFIKPKIYDKGNWLLSLSKQNEQTDIVKKYNFLRALPYISRTDGTEKNFMMFSINITHFPWNIIDEEGNFVTGVTPYENNYWAFSRILEWIAWMKKNDVYDNTRIIILSDHGIRKLNIEDALIFNPFKSMETGKVNINSLFAFTPLMMMKDYGAKNTFKEDSRFLATADMISMALNEDDPFADIPKNPRTLRAYYLHWKINYKSKKFPTERIYEVKDNILDVNNWKLIETHKFD